MKRLGHVPALDGLRGITILLVLGDHFTGWPLGGAYGVDLFFVLSGFLITTLLLAEHAETGRIAFAGFYARRARRLLPALCVMLAAYLAISAAKGEDGLRHVALYGLYFGNIYQAFWVTHPVARYGLEHLWSLAQEEQFYLLWPVGLAVILQRSRQPLRWVAGVAVLFVAWRYGVAFHGANGQRIIRGPDTHSEGLLIGAAVAVWRPRVGETVAKASVATVTLLALVGQLDGEVIFEIGAAGLVLAAVSETELARGLAWRPLVWLGGISYSLYLWHFMLLWAFGWHDRLAVLALSVGTAWASTRFVEQPFRRRRSPGLEPVSSVSPAAKAA